MQLIDPVTTGIIAWTIGIEGIPPLPTWIGGVIISSGISALVIGEHRRKKLQQENQAVDQPESDGDIEMLASSDQDSETIHELDSGTKDSSLSDRYTNFPLELKSVMAVPPPADMSPQSARNRLQLTSHSAEASINGPVMLSPSDSERLNKIKNAVENQICCFSEGGSPIMNKSDD